MRFAAHVSWNSVAVANGKEDYYSYAINVMTAVGTHYIANLQSELLLSLS